MTPVSLFSLEKHAGPYEKWPLESRLYAGGRDTGTRLPGYVIEAQYGCGDHYLVITSYDCPYEEVNEFLLLDRSFAIVARSGLGTGWFATVLLERHEPVAANAIRLHYHNGIVCTLRVEPPALPAGRSPRLVVQREPDAAVVDVPIADLDPGASRGGIRDDEGDEFFLQFEHIRRPGASESQIDDLCSRCVAAFGVKPPDRYFDFLRLSNGLDYNGLVVYDCASSPTAKSGRNFWQGLVGAGEHAAANRTAMIASKRMFAS